MERRTLKSSKSRGGCARCKQKHIKCDETKPACQICQAQGANCPGYQKPLRWSNKHEVYTGPPPPKRQRTTSTSTSTAERPDSAVLSSTRHAHEVTTRTTAPSPINPSTPLLDTPSESGPFFPPHPHASTDDFGWPNLGDTAYEDLTFSSLFPGPSPETHPDSFPYPYMDDSCGQWLPATHSTEDDADLEIGPSDPVLPLVSARELLAVPPHSHSHSHSPPPHASGSGSLLRTFYRLTVPAKVPGFSDDDLVNHYFAHVCAIYSCFDSDLNPFRTLVAAQYSHCKTIRYTIESMAVAHLANFYPHMAPLGLAKRGRAWKSLQQDLRQLRNSKRPIDSVLLSLLLLGISSAWHQASNLGLQYLFTARNLVQLQLQQNEQSATDDFVLDGLMYWETLASFVDPIPMMDLGGLKAPTLELPTRSLPAPPHPWTGVISNIFFALAEVGRVLRRRQRNGMVSTADEDWAMRLERMLDAAPIPSGPDISDYRDPRTPPDDLINVANAYRLVGCLEIYRAFPQVYWNRQEDRSSGRDRDRPSDGDGDNNKNNNNNPPPPTPLPSPPSRNRHTSALDTALVHLATRILDMVKPITLASGACRLLPLLLLMAGSQLRLPDASTTTTTTTTDRSDEDVVVDARYLVEQRMLVLARKYPQRPILSAVDTVKEVWERADAGAGGAHWMDVAHEKCWQTLLG